MPNVPNYSAFVNIVLDNKETVANILKTVVKSYEKRSPSVDASKLLVDFIRHSSANPKEVADCLKVIKLHKKDIAQGDLSAIWETAALDPQVAKTLTRRISDIVYIAHKGGLTGMGTEMINVAQNPDLYAWRDVQTAYRNVQAKTATLPPGQHIDMRKMLRNASGNLYVNMRLNKQNLSSITIHGTHEHESYDGFKFKKTRFQDGQFQQCIFKNCDFSASEFIFPNHSPPQQNTVSFNECTFDRKSIETLLPTLHKLKDKGATINLNGAVFIGDMSDLDFSGISLNGSDFSQARVGRIMLNEETQLRGANLTLGQQASMGENYLKSQNGLSELELMQLRDAVHFEAASKAAHRAVSSVEKTMASQLHLAEGEAPLLPRTHDILTQRIAANIFNTVRETEDTHNISSDYTDGYFKAFRCGQKIAPNTLNPNQVVYNFLNDYLVPYCQSAAELNTRISNWTPQDDYELKKALKFNIIDMEKGEYYPPPTPADKKTQRILDIDQRQQTVHQLLVHGISEATQTDEQDFNKHQQQIINQLTNSILTNLESDHIYSIGYIDRTLINREANPIINDPEILRLFNKPQPVDTPEEPQKTKSKLSKLKTLVPGQKEKKKEKPETVPELPPIIHHIGYEIADIIRTIQAKSPKEKGELLSNPPIQSNRHKQMEQHREQVPQGKHSQDVLSSRKDPPRTR